jgi:tRNA G46 methylase TrmB
MTPGTLSAIRVFDSTSVPLPKGQAPFQLPSSFSPQTPIDLEIGCGVGWHPIQYARQNPSRYVIAIEHTRAKFERFASRLANNAELPNLRPVHADAVSWVTHCLPPQSISRCFLLYPNPEPKAVSRRWLRMPFMQRLLETLAPTGQLTLATNERAYFDEALHYAAEYWKLEVEATRTISATNVPAGFPRTHFEKKYLLRGETCYELVVRKS